MDRTRTTRRPTAALVTTGLMALAACGGANTQETGGDDSGGGVSGAAAPQGEVDRDASFVYAYPITVSRLDPHLASISQDGTTLFPAYDRLVHLSPDGELIPGLAESWEFSEDGLTLTLTIRQGVTFHDGAVLDAEGVRTNLERIRGLAGSPASSDLSSVASVDVPDATTVVLALSEPNVALLGSLADRAGIMVSPQAIADGVDLDEEMVGAGPFRMVEHTPGASTSFERFEEYWDAENPADVASLEIRVLPDEVARLNALQAGQIDATTLAARQVAEVEGDPDVQLVTNTELQYFFVAQNRAREGLDDLRVRQALLHGLDREGICEALVFGLCEVTDQPFPNGYFAHDDSIDDVLYPYDPGRAQELMDDAGVTELELSLLTPAGLSTYPEIAETMQAQWAELGVSVDIQPVEPTQTSNLMFAQEVADSLLATWGGRPDPAQTLFQRTSADGFSNAGGQTTDLMMELIAESVGTVDEEARAEALRAASREVAESALELVLFFPEVPYALGPDVVFEPYLTAKPEFRDVGILG